MGSPGHFDRTIGVCGAVNTANGLGGWPLPALADGHALHMARTKIVF
jgi:hypothetical protein